MIIQPEWGTRNVNKYFYESETRRIAALNEIFGEVELTAAEMRTLVWLALYHYIPAQQPPCDIVLLRQARQCHQIIE